MTTYDETRILLSTLSSVLDKPVPAEALPVWAELLAPVPLAWAKMAAMDLLGSSPFWPKPAEIITRARQLAEEERARQAHAQQLALGRTYAQEPEPEPAGEGLRGYAMATALLTAIRERNKAEPDRAKRWINARMVAADFKAAHGVAPDRPGLTCTSRTCRCSHTEGCDAGWIEVADDDGHYQAYPCPNCNARRHTILTSGSTREAAQRALRDTSDVKAGEGDAW